LLAARYVGDGALPSGSLTDATHIACAAANDLNCVVSYNFKHINRPKTKAMTAEINARLGYRPISIFTAREVLDYEQDDK
jgi:hypothetical protein